MGSRRKCKEKEGGKVDFGKGEIHFFFFFRLMPW